MEFGILVQAERGGEALKMTHLDMSPLCRNIRVQMDRKKSGENLHTLFRVIQGTRRISAETLFPKLPSDISRVQRPFQITNIADAGHRSADGPQENR